MQIKPCDIPLDSNREGIYNQGVLEIPKFLFTAVCIGEYKDFKDKEYLMNIEQSIKEHAKKRGMDLCGIAPVSRFEGAPKGTHPTDFLPGCKSVISVGVRLADGVIQTVMRNFEDGKWMAQGVYGTYG